MHHPVGCRGVAEDRLHGAEQRNVHGADRTHRPHRFGEPGVEHRTQADVADTVGLGEDDVGLVQAVLRVRRLHVGDLHGDGGMSKGRRVVDHLAGQRRAHPGIGGRGGRRRRGGWDRRRRRRHGHRRTRWRRSRHGAAGGQRPGRTGESHQCRPPAEGLHDCLRSGTTTLWQTHASKASQPTLPNGASRPHSSRIHTIFRARRTGLGHTRVPSIATGPRAIWLTAEVHGWNNWWPYWGEAWSERRRRC